MDSLSSRIEIEPQTTIKLEINFSSDEALNGIFTYNQKDFIKELYRSGHDLPTGTENMSGTNLRKKYLIDTLGVDMPYGFSKHYIDEIIKQPTQLQNIDEEELRLLDRYKGAVTAFYVSYLSKSNLPMKIKLIYSNAESLTEFQLDVAWWKALGWYQKHPDADTAIQPNPLLTETYRQLHRQMHGLVDFYNSNRLMSSVQNIVDDKERYDYLNHPEALPILIVENYYSLFCPTDWQSENFDKSVGY
jgi:hypothetical protein